MGARGTDGISSPSPIKVRPRGKGLHQFRKSLKRYIKYRVGSGEEVLFWLDNWVGDYLVAAQFPDLVTCTINKKATVSSYLERHGSRGHLIWTLEPHL